MHPFDLQKDERLKLWSELTLLLEDYRSNTSDLAVSPKLDVEKVRQLACRFSFEDPLTAHEAIAHVLNGIKKYGVHTSHPGYFGLYNPRPNFASIMADMITATLNPQMAAWSHSPFAVEAESFLIQKFGEKFGFPVGSIDGVFCNGGAEANHTAVICAINHALPEYAKSGLKASEKELIIYCSSESHHSIGKAAMMTGLGLDAVKSIAADESQKIRVDLLEKQIKLDLKDGHQPFLIVATTGTTGTGAIDPLPEIAKITKKYNLWLHADAAYGGAAILDPKSKHVLKGIELANSITFDMHKWMSVPMGTSVFLTNDNEILSKSFRITTDYMPKEADRLMVTDPYVHSIQWSRRFIGLRTYLSLLIFGWDGYAKTIQHQFKMGVYLEEKLIENGWDIMNKPLLPVVCFTSTEHMDIPDFAAKMCENLIDSGQTWLSVYPIDGIQVLRACICNYSTTEKEIDDFVDLLNHLKKDF